MIENYTIPQWIAFFVIYCFFGWCIESTIVSVNTKKLTNRGFLLGPVLPIYGSGAVTILAATLWAKHNVVLVYIFGVISSTILEYITGAVMESMFKMKYWDYTRKKYNLNGYICLESSLFWGVLAVLLTCVVHEHIADAVLAIPVDIFNFVLFVIVIIMIADCAESFKSAFDTSKMLAKMAAIKKEMSELEKLSGIKNEVVGLGSELEKRAVEAKNEISAVKAEKMKRLKEEQENVVKKLSQFRYSTIRSFPTATSKKFGETLSEVRERLNTRNIRG